MAQATWPLEYLKECLGLASSVSYAKVPSSGPVLSRGQRQLAVVKTEKTHLLLQRDIKLGELRALCTGKKINAKDSRVVSKVRALKRLDNQIVSYERQQCQLEQVLHQEEMATIANETLMVLKTQSKKARQRKYDAEIDAADSLLEYNEELQEHLDYMTSMDDSPTGEALEVTLQQLLPDVEIHDSNPEKGNLNQAGVAQNMPDVPAILNVEMPEQKISTDNVELCAEKQNNV
tara:strand:+ start:60 stop:758 length:699 start_codon:yes stop_codon:yes gene_type:complete